MAERSRPANSVVLDESVCALEPEAAVVTHFFRKLGGVSQPILAQASDGGTYVVKFPESGRCSNTVFNECLGTKLYMSLGLHCPPWKPLILTDEFIDQNPGCWIKTKNEDERPAAGLCFGSRFMGDAGIRLWEIVPSSWFLKVYQPFNFWRAWFLDVCAEHFDTRQAIFQEGEDRLLYPWFIDHGYMFGGPDDRIRFKALAPRYLDPRIYGKKLPLKRLKDFAEALAALNSDFYWDLLEGVPDEWKTARALSAFARFTARVSDPQLRQCIVDEIVEVYRKSNCMGTAGDPGWRKFPIAPPYPPG